MIQKMVPILSVLLLYGGMAEAQASDTMIARSGKVRVPLVELFSSESCSSCPPAEAWISKLQNESGLWTSFVPVVFHVDYWNHLGWKDGYSSDKMTKRQVELSQHWAEPSVYTPAFAVDGNEWRNWRDPHLSLPAQASQNIEISIFKNTEGNFRVKAVGLKPSKKYVVHLAQLGMGVKTDVKSGENAGRLLKHDFIVLDWDGKPISSQAPEQSFSLPKQKGARLAVAAWIEEESKTISLQSVGAFL